MAGIVLDTLDTHVRRLYGEYMAGIVLDTLEHM